MSPEVRVEEIGDFKYPNRKPWLLFVVLLVIGGIFLYRRYGPERSERPRKVREPVVEQAEPLDDGGAGLATVGDGADAKNLLAQAKALAQQGENDPLALARARTKFHEVLGATADARLRKEAEDFIGKINVKLAFTPMAMPEKFDYIVKRGDTVERIARKFGTTVNLIQKSNLIPNANLIKVGDRYRILSGKFEIVVSKSARDLALQLNGVFFKRYLVGTGKMGKTPTGTFEIYDKITEPVWWRPDGKEIPYGHPENILGTRWMAIRATGETPRARGYGIHGTWNNDSIGKAESAGCVRMRNPEVEELFDLVPLGTPVIVVE